MLATHMPRMPYNKLEIRIAGSCGRSQLISFSFYSLFKEKKE